MSATTSSLPNQAIVGRLEDSKFTLGTRVVVKNKHKGTVRYIGVPHFSDKIWFGVELDEPGTFC